MTLAATFGAKEAFLGPWTGKKIADWTPAVREKEMQTLAKVLELETRAIAELGKALAAAGVDVGPLIEAARWDRGERAKGAKDIKGRA